MAKRLSRRQTSEVGLYKRGRDQNQFIIQIDFEIARRSNLFDCRKMWELGFKFKYVWSLLLFFSYLENLTQGFNSDLDSNGDVDWDWMQTGKLGMLEGGQWLRPSLCPGGSFVTGYQMKYGQENATGEITGLRLHCSTLDQNHKLKPVGTLNANGAFISSQNSLSVTSNGQAVGFSMARWLDSQGVESVGGRMLKFMGEAESGKSKYSFRFPRKANSTLLVSVGCPEDWAICGVQARENDVEDDEPILTQLRFKCCYYCTPQEKRVILVDYTNPGSTDYTRTIQRTVGTHVDRRTSISGSNSRSTDWTKEIQKGNSISLSTSESKTDGDTSSSSIGTRDSRGWNTGEELKVLINNQNSRDSRVSGSTSTSESDSRSVGKSKAQTDSTHWSQTKGTSSSTTDEESLEVGARVGFSAFGVTAEVSVNGRSSESQTRGQHEDRTRGGSDQTENRSNEEDTKSNQKGNSKDESEGTSNTDSKGKETSTNQGQSGGNTVNKEKSRQKSIQRAKEQSMQQGAQSMFTQRQANQKSWQFTWDQSDSYMWREEREDTYSFTCEAMHRCKIEQVYGTCGAIRIGTTKIEKRILILKYGQHGGNPEPEVDAETGFNSTQEIQWNINITGETWVVAKGISQWEPSGHWQNVQVCPPDTIVTGHMFKYLPRDRLTGITLICSGKYGPDEGEKEHDHVHILRISSEDDLGRNRTKGSWGILARGSRSTFAEGYGFVQQEMNGRRWMGNQEIIYHNITLMNVPNSFAVNSSRVVTKCPLDHAICGLTAMKDKSGIGILTAFGFKCCHHCIPEEKWVTVHRFINKSPSDERKEVRATIGLSKTQANGESNSVNTGNSTDSAGINRQGLHAGFSARFGKSSSTGFDWSHTKNSVWNEETTMTEMYTCEAFSSCTYRKLVGQCGSVRVPVDQFEKISVPLQGYGPDPDSTDPLDPETETGHKTPSESPGSSSRALRVYPNQYNLEEEPTPVQVMPNGEIWIEAQNIQIQDLRENTNPIWGKSESCPLGTFVTGYRFKKFGGEDEDTQELLNGLELECSRWNAQGNFQQVKMIEGDKSGRSASDKVADLVQSDSPAVGFSLFVYEWFDEDEELLGQDTTGHALIFDRWSTPTPPDFTDSDYEIKVTPEKVVCPTDYVICGVRTKKDENTGILTDVRFQCCYHCEPSEMEVDLDLLENPADVPLTLTIPDVSVGAAVEVKNPILNGSAPNTFTLLKGFSDYRYIRAMFSQRLPKTSRRVGQPKVDWSRQPKSVWTRELEIKQVYSCKARHSFVVTQVVGICGKLQIPTSVILTQYTPIVEDISDEGEEQAQEEDEQEHD